MLLVKTPLRITFCGGGTDYDYFYEKYGGMALNAAVNYYTYVMIKPYYDKHMISLRYSNRELISTAEQVAHPYFREVLKAYPELKGIEIINASDVPHGMGMASSSSFAAGLVNLLHMYTTSKELDKYQLAEQTYDLERATGLKCGKQDQYAVSFGGINLFEFHRTGAVSVKPLVLDLGTIHDLHDNLVIYKTGTTHNNFELSKKQNDEGLTDTKVKCLNRMADLACDMYNALVAHDLSSFGEMLHENWMLKKQTSTTISNSLVDDIYETARQNGALGGKLMGAGEGGCMLFYCPKSKQVDLDKALNGLEKLPFEFDFNGSRSVKLV